MLCSATKAQPIEVNRTASLALYHPRDVLIVTDTDFDRADCLRKRHVTWLAELIFALAWSITVVVSGRLRKPESGRSMPASSVAAGSSLELPENRSKARPSRSLKFAKSQAG